MAEHIEVARAFVTIVPSLEGSQKSIAEQLGAEAEPAAEKAGEESGKKFGGALAKGLKATGAVIGAAMTAATAAAVATGKAFISAANDVSEMGNTIDKQSQKLGISAQSYQEWAFILEHSGASIDGMTSSMKKLVTAAESGNDAFAALGITQEELASMNQEELFTRTVAALQNVESETQRTALASQLLGKGAMELGPLFNMTAEETEAMRQQVHELGGVMSDEAVKDAAKYQDELQNMNTALDGVKKNMISKFLPGMSSVMEGLSKVFSGNDGGIEMIREGLSSVVGQISKLSPQFFALAESVIMGVLDGFAPMLPSLVSSVFSFLNQAILKITQMIPQLTPVITAGIRSVAQAVFSALPVITSALIDMTSELVTWLASGNNVKTFVDGVLQLVNQLVMSFAQILPILLPAVVNIIGQIADSLTEPDNINMIIEGTLYVIGAVAVAIWEAMPEIVSLVFKLTENLWGLLKDWGGKLFKSIGPWITSIGGKIAQWFVELGISMKTRLANIWSGIKEWFSKLPSNITNAFAATKKVITGWATSAVQWGKDMIQGFINGVKKMASSLASAVKNLASNISQYLHFSVPDKGPLATADEWMPDMVSLMVKGIEEGAPKLQDAVTDLGLAMNSEVRAYTGAAPALSGGNTYNGGNINVNVYGAQGQSVTELARAVAYEIENLTQRKGIVYAESI